MASSEQIREAASFLERLTLPRVLLAFLAGAGAVILWALWDDRRTWVGLLWQSQIMPIVAGLGGALLIVGYVIATLMRRVEAAQNAFIEQLRAQNGAMQKQIDELHHVSATRWAELQTVRDAEARCLERLRQILLRIEGGDGRGGA